MAQRAKRDEAEATISVNGGPAVPLARMREALDKVRAATGEDVGGIAADRLRSIVDRIERLNEERKALGSDITGIFAEAKGAGFDVKAVRQIIRMRKWEPAELEEHETLIDLYRRALGML